MPPATAAPRPRWALAGVVASEPAAMVATAAMAANVIFMSWALLEMAPLAAPGLRFTHTPYSRLAVSLKSAQQSIESKRGGLLGRKKGFFRPIFKDIPGNRPFPGTSVSI
jgi:hypothetical protein